MNSGGYRFEFRLRTPLAEAEMTFHLALYAVEGLYGEARVRLEAAYSIEPKRKEICVRADTEVGEAVAKVFTGLLRREFGDDAFQVHRVEDQHVAKAREDRR